METSVETLEGNKVRLRVAVPASEFESAIDAAFRKLAREVRIPGFRPGKAPRRLLEARLGTEIAREQALRDSLPEYYTKAVAVEALDTIAAPEIDITGGQEDGDVEFAAVVEVRPIPEISGYKGLQVEVANPQVDEADIDAQVDALRERFADLTDSAAPLAKGDYAQLNIKGYVHDEEVAGLTATDFLYEIGSELEGRRPGDIVRFNDALPARWGERAGQEVSFQVMVKETKRKVLPAVTDEWAREASEFDTFEQLRADIANRLGSFRKMQAQLALREKVLDAVAGLVDIDVPESLVEAEMEQRLHSIVHRLSDQGATVEQYLAATGQTQDQLVGQVRIDATHAVKADLALRAVAIAEGIEVTDEEIEAEVVRLAERTKQKPAQLRKEIERGRGREAIRSELSRGKALQLLVDEVLVYDEEGNALDLTIEMQPGEEPTEEQAAPTAEEEPEQ